MVRNLNHVEFTTFINTLANAITNNITDDELSILAAVFTQLGDTLATIALIKGLGSEDKEI